MSEGTVLQTMSGATLAISATLPETYDAAGYQSTDLVWSTIGQVENHGNHGVTKNVSSFTAVADGVVQKFGGAKNYGQKAVVLGCLPSDSGQDLLEAASESNNRYSIKVTYPLRAGETTPETHYLDALVTGFENQDGAVDDVRKIGCNIEICRKPVKVPAA